MRPGRFRLRGDSAEERVVAADFPAAVAEDLAAGFRLVAASVMGRHGRLRAAGMRGVCPGFGARRCIRCGGRRMAGRSAIARRMGMELEWWDG